MSDQQLTLFDQPRAARRAEPRRRLSIDERFAEFSERRPEVYAAFKALAWKLKAQGRSYYSADAIVHLVRLHHDLERGAEDAFLIDNSFVSRLARKLTEECPEFEGFFRFRALKSRREAKGGDGS